MPSPERPFGLADALDAFDAPPDNGLRRVPGLSSRPGEETAVEQRSAGPERVVLVGAWTSGTLAEAESSLAELAALAEAAGGLVLDGVIQRRDRPDPAT